MNCFYCDCEVFPRIHRNKPRSRKFPRATEDHIIPKSRTKKQPASRTVFACCWCNEAKGSLTIDEYRIVLAFRYGYISQVEYVFPGEAVPRTDVLL